MQNLTETEQPVTLPAQTLAGRDAHAEASSHARLSGRLITAASLTGLGSVVGMALALFGSIAIARNSGPAGYALYVIANMLVFVPVVICSLGIPMALSRHAAREEERGHHETLRSTITTMLLLQLSLVLLTGVLMSLNLQYFERQLGVRLGPNFALMLPFLLVCGALADGVQGTYFGLLRTRKAIFISIVAPAATILYVLVYRTGAGLPLWGAVAAFYISSAVFAAYSILKDRLLGRPLPLTQVTPILRDLLPASVFTLFMTFTVWSDRWIAGSNLGAVAMGSYAAAVVIIQAVLRVPKNMAVMIVPASARVSTSGAERGESFNRAMISHFALFASMLSVVLMLAPGLIVRTIFGPGFSFAAPTLLLMTPSVLAAAISIPFLSALTGSTRNRLVTYLLIFTTIPRIALLLVFTRLWSLMGTALATMFSDWLLALCCLVLARVSNSNFSLRPFVRPFLLGLFAYALGLGALLLGVPTLPAIALALSLFSLDLWRVAQSILRRRK